LCFLLANERHFNANHKGGTVVKLQIIGRDGEAPDRVHRLKEGHVYRVSFPFSEAAPADARRGSTLLFKTAGPSACELLEPYRTFVGGHPLEEVEDLGQLELAG
jgi:hypothetical protein